MSKTTELHPRGGGENYFLRIFSYFVCPACSYFIPRLTEGSHFQWWIQRWQGHDTPGAWSVAIFAPQGPFIFEKSPFWLPSDHFALKRKVSHLLRRLLALREPETVATVEQILDPSLAIRPAPVFSRYLPNVSADRH